MTVLALSTANGAFAAFVLFVALIGALAAIVLLTRVVIPALEIRRYAKHIEAAGNAIAENLRGVDELDRTRALVTPLPERVEAYGARLRRRS